MSSLFIWIRTRGYQFSEIDEKERWWQYNQCGTHENLTECGNHILIKQIMIMKDRNNVLRDEEAGRQRQSLSI